ncbi:MAG: hypothetical protein GXP08_04575 [Gammaproteobacteria bacterium]|nr:hypothetical protein [Gammaproteobacteria bacterium]
MNHNKLLSEKRYFINFAVLLLSSLAILPTQSIASLDSSALLNRFTPMTQDKMTTLIHLTSKNITSHGSNIQFEYKNVRMACISDTKHDRMRIISPVANEADLTEKQLKTLLAANFHLTLDARYATSNGVVYAAFIHPMSSLHEKSFLAALQQVSQLVKNFGTSYSSSELTFGRNKAVLEDSDTPGTDEKDIE